MTYPHWEYFLAIEADLIKASRFVEFSSDNFSAYSIEFTHILLSSSSEVDVIAKSLCSEISPSETHRNINEYRRTIVNAYSRLPEIEVKVPRYGLTFQPWISWKEDDNPDWWHSYNAVKHERDVHYRKANLENTLNSVAGLFIFVLFLYRRANQSKKLFPLPQLLTSSLYEIPSNPANVTFEDLMELYR